MAAPKADGTTIVSTTNQTRTLKARRTSANLGKSYGAIEALVLTAIPLLNTSL
jgi:hypothetical protein